MKPSRIGFQSASHTSDLIVMALLQTEREPDGVIASSEQFYPGVDRTGWPLADFDASGKDARNCLPEPTTLGGCRTR